MHIEDALLYIYNYFLNTCLHLQVLELCICCKVTSDSGKCGPTKMVPELVISLQS